MRKVDVVRPPINYVVSSNMYSKPYPIAWFVVEEDAEDFVKIQPNQEKYEIAEVRK